MADYAHMSFSDVVELDCYTFKYLLCDAFISNMRQSKEGQEYLENCWLIKQTTPDKETLRKRFSRGGK